MSQAVMVRNLDGFVFSWADRPLIVTLSRIHESTQGIRAELQAKYSNGAGKLKTLTHQTLNLLTSKSRLASELKRKHDADWAAMLEQVCFLTLRELRQGMPIESLVPTSDDHPAWFILNPLLYHNNPTIIYGPGDSLKSMLALYCGLLLASGCSGIHLGCAPTPWKVLFLDWEMSVQDVRGRVKLLQAGDPHLTGVPSYRRCVQPLADEAEGIKKLIAEDGYDVLIIDSLAMAAGGQELERADRAIRFNAALRGFGCTSLVIGHTPKPQEDQKQRSLYGSVFFSNLCRVSWEMQREGDTIGLYQRKNNLGRAHPPLGFTITTTETACSITEADLFDEPTLAANMPVVEQVAQALKQHPGQTLDELALATGEKKATIKSKLYRFKHRFIAVDGKWECLT